MNCTVLPLRDLDESDRHCIIESACKPNSDFQAKLCDKILDDRDGWIAIVRDQGEIVGWARTEKWCDKDSGEEFDTLESFTRHRWRRRGVCKYAVAGLLAAGKIDRGPLAIFSSMMIGTCRVFGIRWEGYENVRDCWVKTRY
jgi:hypothetical protein